MEKQWLKRISSVGLALILAVGLCACGGSMDGENTGGLSADSGAYTVNDTDSVNVPGNANAALAKENVYRVSEVEIPKLTDSGNVPGRAAPVCVLLGCGWQAFVAVGAMRGQHGRLKRVGGFSRSRRLPGIASDG